MGIKEKHAALQARLSQKVYSSAIETHTLGKSDQLQFPIALALILSVLVILSPLLLAFLGIVVVMFDFPNLLTITTGGVLFLVAIALRPRFEKMPSRVYGPQDLPELFKLLDSIAEQLKIDPIRHVYFSAEFNASVTYVGWRRQKVLHIGLTLWQASSNQERVSLLSHELAHFANNDPSQGLLIANAIQTINGWRYYLTPQLHEYLHDGTYASEVDGLAESVIEFILGLIRAFFDTVEMGITWLFFFRQQQAEYLADALEAEVAGTDTAVSALELLTLIPLVEKEVSAYHPIGKPDGIALINRFSNVVKDAAPSVRREYLEKSENQKLCIDSTHPPTALRIAFLKTLTQRTPIISAEDFDFSALDAQFQPHLERVGLDLADMLEVQ